MKNLSPFSATHHHPFSFHDDDDNDDIIRRITPPPPYADQIFHQSSGGSTSILHANHRQLPHFIGGGGGDEDNNYNNLPDQPPSSTVFQPGSLVPYTKNKAFLGQHMRSLDYKMGEKSANAVSQRKWYAGLSATERADLIKKKSENRRKRQKLLKEAMHGSGRVEIEDQSNVQSLTTRKKRQKCHKETENNFAAPETDAQANGNLQKNESNNSSGGEDIETHETVRQIQRLKTKGPTFLDHELSELHELQKVSACTSCQAERLEFEPPTFCCSSGDVLLACPDVPEFLWTLFTCQSPECRQFRQQVRAYNSIFGFTSFGVNLDKELATSKRGVYTFRAQGQIYHNLPSATPSTNGPCYFQMYFYDTDNELQNRMNVLRDASLSESLVRKLMELLSINPYAQVLRTIDPDSIDDYIIHIRSDVQLDQRVYNAPSADQVAGIWIEGNNPCIRQERDIVVHSTSGQMHRVRHYYGCYDPLQYPLLFPRGEVGWHQNILKREGCQANKRSKKRKRTPTSQGITSAEDIFSHEEEGVDGESAHKVSCRQYYCYKLQIRRNQRSILLMAGRLLQQYAVDMYIKLENTRLDFFRKKQSAIRADLYDGIVDSVLAGETRGKMVGKHIVLPASFIGGPRDMRRRYLDAISLVQRFGKPDLFITMTCNPEWKEITDLLEEGQVAQDRPDLTARVFRAKFKDLKNQLFTKCIFGEVAAHVHVIEFQKRGLPHVHMLIILHRTFKIMTAEQFDKYVCAEIPDPEKYPQLYEKVVKHMLHGPCGHLNMKNSCMRQGRCKSRYPRPYSERTVQADDSYPLYKRSKNSFTAHVRNAHLDNRWVVPYNAYLLSRYNCHINVEICSSVKSVKYLYKYIYKGPDQVAFTIDQTEEGADIDEIRQYQQARWVSSQEAIWRLFEFELNEIYPAVIRLQLHLPNKQLLSYWENQDLRDLIASDLPSKTMLTEFFEFCKKDEGKGQYLYRDFPEQFVWEKKAKCWQRRKKRFVIGRINGCNPNEGERYYLRLLLNHVKSPTSFNYLLTVNGVVCPSFKSAAELRGLFQSDNWISESLLEAATFQMPKTLRQLFATILVYCEPGDVRKLWVEHSESMSEDFARIEGISPNIVSYKTLKSVESFLQSLGRNLKDFDLPTFDATLEEVPTMKREISEELAVEVPYEDEMAMVNLNPEQLRAYNTILQFVNNSKAGVFFIDGPGGTGKTFLYRALLATTRLNGDIAIATATSGVAASIMPGGRTAHSRFKIPINIDEASTCNISKQSGTAALLQSAKIIIWDEAPMAKRWAIEAFDRSMRDIMGNRQLFGGKVIVFGGDFRQVLPVVPRGSRAETVDASLVRSYLWPEMIHLKLTTNMRAQADLPFSEFLLRVGNGEEPTTHEDMIRIPDEMVIVGQSNESRENCLINTIYPALKEHANSSEYISNRAILATRNEYVDMLNEKMINIFPGQEWRYHSFDKAIDDTHNYYPEEFLNSLTPNGLPPHELVLKLNSPIMLLRNVNPSEGLCNGTRMVCRGFEKNIVHAEITFGQHAGKQVFLPRIPMMPAENESYPFMFKRTQFPIRLCFAMTINKSQGQTIPNVGVYLPQPVFSHGQLYVALSRGTSMSSTKVLAEAETKQDHGPTCTRNVVYREVLTSELRSSGSGIELHPSSFMNISS